MTCICLLGIVACGDDRRGPTKATPVGPEGGVLTFDAAMIGGGDAALPRDGSSLDATSDSAAPVDCTGLPPVSTIGELRTAFPHIAYTTSPGNHRLLSANFIVTHDGDSRGPLLEVFAEIRNDGTSIACQHLPDVDLDFMEIIALIEGVPYYDDFSRVTNDCMAPGQVGVLVGVARGIDEDTLAAASSMWMDLDPSTLSTPYRAALDGPTITRADVVSTADGWALQGELRINTTLHNYGLRVYPRDSRGVLVDELLAFPMRLATLYAGSIVPYETNGTACTFADHVSFQSWITGLPRSGFLPGPVAPLSELERAIAARRAQMDDLRTRR